MMKFRSRIKSDIHLALFAVCCLFGTACGDDPSSPLPEDGSVQDGTNSSDAANAVDASRDAAETDAGLTDAEAFDAEGVDAATVDGATRDAATADAAVVDAARPDSGPPRYVTEPSSTTEGSRRMPEFGIAVAISSDGTTLAVGDWEARRVFVYERDADGEFPATPAHTLSAPASGGTSYAGSVGVSGDGAYIAVGDYDYGPPTKQGAVHVYLRARDGTYPSAPSQTILPPATYGWMDFGSDVVPIEFGISLRISADASTLAVGDTSFTGAVSVYKRSGDLFSTTHNQILRSPIFRDTFGTDIGLSADASTMVVSDYAAATVYRYRRERSGLYGAFVDSVSIPGTSFGGAPSYFGACVALTSDAGIMVVGDNTVSDVGGASMLVAGSTGAFTSPASQTFAAPPRSLYFGTQCDITGDGSLIVISDVSYGGVSGYGAVHFYPRL